MNTKIQTFQDLFDDPTMQALGDFASERGVRLYLVGGSVRDLLLKRQTADIDFALDSDAIRFAMAFADRIRAIGFALENPPPTGRVIIKRNKGSRLPELSMDFVQFRAESLTEDLRLRDLTINAMAIAFEDVESIANNIGEQNSLNVIDPCGGMKDLETGLLRFPSEEVVEADPLRLLRIYRFAAQLDFTISKEAVDLVTKHLSSLPNVAIERCRDELMKIFSVQKACPYLQQIERIGLLTQFLPFIKTTCNFWHPLETFEENPIPEGLQGHSGKINGYLRETIGMETSRYSFIKFTLLLGDDLSAAGAHFRMSHKVIDFMRHLIKGCKSLQYVNQQSPQKRIMRFLRKYASDCWGVLLYTAASDTIDPGLLERIVNTYYEDFVPIRQQGRLLTGDDLVKHFNLTEGKQIGRLLKHIETRQFYGEIRTREEALAAVAALIEPPDLL